MWKNVERKRERNKEREERQREKERKIEIEKGKERKSKRKKTKKEKDHTGSTQHTLHSFSFYYQMKPQNQRTRERARKSERGKVFACSSCSALNYLLWLANEHKHRLAHLFTLNICQSPGYTSQLIAVKPLLPVWSLIAQLISECRVTLNCLAPYTSHVLQHTQISQKQSERERACLWCQADTLKTHLMTGGPPFLFSTKQLRPPLPCRELNRQCLWMSNQVLIRVAQYSIVYKYTFV